MRKLPLRVRRTPAIKLAIHSAIYRWAAYQGQWDTVLDLGCAEGFGSAILDEHNFTTTGVDWDVDLIEIARQEITGASFIVADCEALELPGAPRFDCVINNAVLEHVTDCELVMEGALSHMTKSGVMIVGTKNAASCLQDPGGNPLYGNHNREFHYEELVTFLDEYFEEVVPYLLEPKTDAADFLDNKSALQLERILVKIGVKEIIPRGLRMTVRKWMTGVSVDDLAEFEFNISPRTEAADPTQAHYLLAIARKPREKYTQRAA